MKKLLIGTTAFFCLAVLSAFQQAAQENPCDSKELKDKTRKALDPYRYDSSKLIKISSRTKEFMKEVEVPLFIGEKYRFVFNTEALSKPVEINIYNKDKDSRNRKLLYSSKDAKAGTTAYMWECTRSMKVFVDYSIPAGEQGTSIGCVMFMVGYK